MSRVPVINPQADPRDASSALVVILFGIAAMMYVSYSLFVLAYGGWTWWAILCWLLACQISKRSGMHPVLDLLCWVFAYPFVLGLVLAWF